MSLDIKLGSYQFGNYVDTFEISQDSRVEQTDIPRRHGSMSDVGYRSGISIRIGGLIYCDSYLDTRTAFNLLKNAFQLGKAVLTVFSDRQILVQKTSFQSSYEEQDLRRIRWDAELMSDDFGFIDVDPTVTTISASASPQTDIHAQAGNLDTNHIIRITANTDAIAGGLRIDNLTTGKYFIYNAAIAAGHWVAIDTDLLTVVNDAGANMLANFSGDFFTLAPGNNSIKWTGTVSGAVKPTYRLTYSGKYDGI